MIDIKRINKILSLILIITIVLTFSACSKTEVKPEAQPAAQPSAQPAADTSSQPAASTEAQPATTTPAPAETGTATDAAPAQAPTDATNTKDASKTEAQPSNEAGSTQTPAADAPKEQAKSEYALKAPIGEKPVLLTSVGQSADVQMVKAIMNKAKIETEFNAVAKAEDISGIKTLVVAVGGSSKGLGAAGIKAEDELERSEALLKKAKKQGTVIICLHIGGEARRGELSDKFINAAIPYADYVIVVADGNKDKIFDELIKSNSIPMDTIDKISKAVDPLKNAFK